MGVRRVWGEEPGSLEMCGENSLERCDEDIIKSYMGLMEHLGYVGYVTISESVCVCSERL